MKIKSYQIVTISGWISKFIQAILQIYIIRLLTTFLGTEDYAIYTLLAALLGWVLLSDFGLNISLQNYISEYKSKNKNYKNIISTAICLSIIFFVILSIVFYPLSYFVAPIYLKQFLISENEKIFIFYFVCIIFLITTLVSIIYKIFYALHKGYISNLIPALGTIITFILLFNIMQSGNEFNKFPLLCSLIISFFPQFILPLCLLVFFIIKQKIYLKLNFEIAKQLIKRAYKFFGFAVMATFVLQIDYVVASRYLSSNDIILYNTLSKIYLFVFVLYSSLLFALWPIIAEHFSKNELNNIKLYIKTYIPIGCIFVIIFSIFIYFFSSNIFSFLIQNTIINANFLIIILFMFYYILRIWTDTFSMVLQSANILKPFWIIVPLQAIISILAQIYFTKQIGIYGIPIGLILSFLFTTVWYLPLVVYKNIIH